jgi:regulator of protease activity HflC (stomatin/prohibitin superfamily)
MLMYLDGGQIVALIFVGFVLITLMAGIRQVPQGKHYTVERFGRFSRTLTPGLGLVIPYIETIGAKVVMMEQVLDVPTQEVITKDNASAKVDGVIFYQVTDASRATYQVAQLDYALLNLTMTNIRNVMGSMDLDQLLSNRDDINQKLLAVVDAAASPWGVKVTRIELKNIEPPADLAAAMARQMKAERDRRAAILEAEGQRQAAILKAEGEKQAQILAAEGRKEAAFRDAEARERGAEAEANATRMVSDAIAKGDVSAVNYLIAEKYVGAFAKLATAPNQKTVIVPAEMGGLIGTLGGIAEIARATFSDGPKGESGTPPRRPWPDQPKS